jgi:hypothetical protein
VARALRRTALAAAVAAVATLATGTVSLGSGGIRDESFHSPALRGTVRFDHELGAAHVPHGFRVYPGGHEQRLWTAEARAWLALALGHLQAPTRP